jgi:hypothetical protein
MTMQLKAICLCLRRRHRRLLCCSSRSAAQDVPSPRAVRRLALETVEMQQATDSPPQRLPSLDSGARSKFSQPGRPAAASFQVCPNKNPASSKIQNNGKHLQTRKETEC